MDYNKVTINAPSGHIPVLEYALQCHHIQGWVEEGQSLVFYVPMDDCADDLLDSLQQDLDGKASISIVVEVLKGEDWEHSWKLHFKRQKIGHFVIKPTWESYEALPGELIIEIDPGMAFGTGDHATTALCLEMLEVYVKEGHKVIDLGTGSGILSIGALMRGAGSLCAVDHDPLSIAAAGDNFRRLGLSDRVTLVKGDVTILQDGSYDLALGNILKPEVIELIEKRCPFLKEGGVFICSGVTIEQLEEVEKAALASGWQVLDKRIRESWGALAAQK